MVPGGRAVIAVNASSEWLPRAARVRPGTVRGVPATADAPSLRELRWVYLVVLALLCGEWILRRRRGMR
jgi:hypothetical protein